MTVLSTRSGNIEKPVTRLRLIQTTDVHMNLSTYDYFADKEQVRGSLLGLSGVIMSAQNECPNSLLLDTGDFLQGTPLGDYAASQATNNNIAHPAISLMNAMGYDAATIGNHEFNFGLDFLLTTTTSAAFPVVLANAATVLGDAPRDDTTLFPPYVILTRQVKDETGAHRPIRLGLIGFTPPQVSVWERRHLDGHIKMRSILETAKAYIPKMKAEGADLIIALSHSGIAHADDPLVDENASLQLAEVAEIDAILCGHQHKRFPSPHFDSLLGADTQRGTLHGTPTVMPGHWGSEIGIIDLHLEHCSKTGWRILDHVCTLRSAPSEPVVDPKLSALMHDHHVATLNYIRTPVAETAVSLHTHFSYLGFDLATRVVALAQRARAIELLGATDLPILSAAAPFRAGGHAGPDHFTEVEKGALTFRDLSDLYMFPNTLSVMQVTGSDLHLWLERASAKFRQIVPGQPNQPALDESFPSYNFDMILGVEYEIDPSYPVLDEDDPKPPPSNAGRIKNLCFKGAPVRNTDSFLVATNSYRAGGGGQPAGKILGTEVLTTQEEIRTLLLEQFRRARTWDMPHRTNWRFTPVDNASILFPLSPRARRFLPDLPLELTPVGQTQHGFDLYRLDL